MNRKIILTADGSHSLHVDELDEQYHSIHGAIQESQHVFIEHGLKFVKQSKWDVHILEVGFGTGLNALLTGLERNKGDKFYYTTLEAFPLEDELIAQLNYADAIGTDRAQIYWKEIHEAQWEKQVVIDFFFVLKKLQQKLEDFSAEAEFDLVYFDAFAPNKQPEMWTNEMLAKVYDALKPGGVLVTYCSRGQVRRDLEALGFTVERLDGPPGKKHMVRAIK